MRRRTQKESNRGDLPKFSTKIDQRTLWMQVYEGMNSTNISSLITKLGYPQVSVTIDNFTETDDMNVVQHAFLTFPDHKTANKFKSDYNGKDIPGFVGKKFNLQWKSVAHLTNKKLLNDKVKKTSKSSKAKNTNNRQKKSQKRGLKQIKSSKKGKQSVQTKTKYSKKRKIITKN